MFNFFRKTAPEDVERLLKWQKLLMPTGPDKLILSEKRLQRMTDMMAANAARTANLKISQMRNTKDVQERAAHRQVLKKQTALLQALEPYVKSSNKPLITQAQAWM